MKLAKIKYKEQNKYDPNIRDQMNTFATSL